MEDYYQKIVEEIMMETILTVKIMEKMLLWGMEEEIELEANILKKFTGEKWISVSIYLPKDFKSVEPVSTSLFQIYEWGNTNQQRHPRMMLRVKNGNLEPRYFAVNGMDSPGWVKKDLKIDDMREKWTTIIFHANMTKDPLKGFVKMYVNGELYNDYEGRTGYGGKFFNKFGIYHSWISRWTEVYGEYPTQVVYYDNLV